MNVNRSEELRGHLTEALRLAPLNSPILALLTMALPPFSRGDFNEVRKNLLATKQAICEQNLRYLHTSPLGVPRKETPLARTVDAALALTQSSSEDLALTPQELEFALSKVAGQVCFGSVFVERGRSGWYVGRNGASFSEPEALDECGVWEGTDNHYFPTLLDALGHAKRFGYLK